MISIVIPSYKRADVIAFMVANLFHQTIVTRQEVEIIVSIDSVDPEKNRYEQYLVQLEQVAKRISNTLEVKLLINDTQGLVAAKNNAIATSKGEYVMMLDDDLLMEDSYIEQLLKDLESGESIGAVSGFIVSYSPAISHTQPSDKITSLPSEYKLQTLQIDQNDGKWRTLFGQKEQVMDWSDINKTIPKTTRFIMDYFVNSYIFRKEAYQKIGGYNLALNSKTSAHEEVDFTFRMMKSGYTLLFNPFAAMWHITIGQGGIYKGTTYQESKAILEKEYTESVPVFMKSIG